MSYLVITSLIISLLITLLSWLLLHKKPTTKLPPGPYPLPIIGNLHMLGPLPHRSLAKLAQKYGPIMSLKLGHVQAIVVSSPQAAQLFLKQHDIIFASRPAMEVVTHLFYGAKDMAFSPYGDYWRRVRKICTLHLLTARKVESFECLRRNEIEKMLVKLKEGSKVDVGQIVGELIEEITFKMVVGKGKDDDEVIKKYDLKDVVGRTLELAGAFNFADFLPFLGPFDVQGLTKKMKQLSIVMDEILEDIINDHLKEENLGQQQDILGSMLTLMNNPSDEFFNSSTSFERDNIKGIMVDLFCAGIDTASHSITWAISALLKQPRAMKLLRQELDTIVGKSRMVKESDLPKLPYLDMVVKETLRLYPVGPMLIPRESMQDIVINECKIPNKSRIIINFWAIARDPKVWSDNAEEFYPERFISRDNNVDVLGNNYDFIPFGSGRRGCPGIQLGLVTIKIVLAYVVHCFDLGLPYGMQSEQVDMTEKFGLSMGRANELYVVPSFRLLQLDSIN